MSSSTPKPRDLNKVVLKLDGEEVRLRRDDEATEAGGVLEHTRYIVCCNVGVRGSHRVRVEC